MDPDVIAYLMDKDAIPETGPLQYSPPSENRIIGSGGIEVSQSFDKNVTVVSISESLEEQIRSASKPQGDPLSGIAFMCSYNQDGQTVTVKPGYLSYTKWSNAAWAFDEFETEEETKDVTSLPAYVYLVVPMKTNSSNINDGTSPFGTFSGTADIEGTTYATEVTYTTDWTGPDEAALTGLIDVVSEPHTDASSDFRRILATIDEDGNVSPRHFSGLTIPQSFNGRIISLSIV